MTIENLIFKEIFVTFFKRKKCLPNLLITNKKKKKKNQQQQVYVNSRSICYAKEIFIHKPCPLYINDKGYKQPYDHFSKFDKNSTMANISVLHYLQKSKHHNTRHKWLL